MAKENWKYMVSKSNVNKYELLVYVEIEQTGSKW